MVLLTFKSLPERVTEFGHGVKARSAACPRVPVPGLNLIFITRDTKSLLYWKE